MTSRDCSRISRRIVFSSFAVLQMALVLLLLYYPPLDVIVPDFSALPIESAPPDTPQADRMAFGSPRMCLQLAVGAVLALPVLLLLAAAWSREVHEALNGLDFFWLRHLPLVLLTAFLVPVMPEEVVHGLGWRSSHGGRPGSGPWFWILLGPLYGLPLSLGLSGTPTLAIRLTVAAIATLGISLYLISVCLTRWHRAGRLGPPQPIPFRFSLRSALLALLALGAYLSILTLAWR